MIKHRASGRQGMALILSLLVLSLLIIIILQMSYSSAQSKSIAQNYTLDLQNSYAARSGYHLAGLFLQADAETAPDVDSLHEKWAQPIQKEVGASQLTVNIEDAERRINLAYLIKSDGKINVTVEKHLKNLVMLLGQPDEVVEMIVDYMDADKNGKYEDVARNGLPINAEEFLRIKDFKREYLFGGKVSSVGRSAPGGGDVTVKGLSNFITLWPRAAASAPPGPGQGAGTPQTGVHKININTAPVEVLMALSVSLTPELANAIVAHRNTQGQDGKMKEFKNIDELKAVQGMTDEVYNQIKNDITVKSRTFLIKATARAGKLEKSWMTVATRAQGGKITPLYSQRIHTLLTIAPPEKDSNQ